MKQTTTLLLLLTILTFGYAQEQQPVAIHGFVGQGFFLSRNNQFLVDNSTEGSWELREIGINFTKTLGEKIDIGIQLLSRDVGVYGNNKLFLDWAYGKYSFNEMIGISTGRVKVPFGFYGDIQDFSFLRSTVFLPEAVYPIGTRNFTTAFNGVQLSGTFDLGRAGSIEYATTIGDVDFGEDTDYSQWIKELGAIDYKTGYTDLSLNGHLLYNTPLSGLRFVASYLGWHQVHSEQVVFPQKIDLGNGTTVNSTITGDIVSHTNWFYGGVQYSNSLFDLTAEYRRCYTPGSYENMVVDINGFEIPQSDTTYTTHRGGGYVSGAVRPLPWLQVGSYFMYYFHNLEDKDGSKWITKATGENPWDVYRYEGALCLNFSVADHLLIQVEGHHVNGAALLSNSLNPNGFAEKWQYGVVKVAYNF